MKFLVIVKASEESEAGAIPSTEALTAMGKFNEELSRAGIMLAAEGVRPSSKGARVKFEGNKRTVIDGPFAETKELVAGFWIWQLKSMDEAIEWAKRIPNPTGDMGVVEIRQIQEPDDFSENMTPELKEQERRIAAQVSQRK